MPKTEGKPLFDVLIVFHTTELSIIVEADIAKTLVNGLGSEETIRFFAVSDTFYAVDYRNVLYIRTKPWVVKQEQE